MWYHGEAGRELIKFRIGLVVVVLFLVSAWNSWQEFRYALWGRTVNATAHRVYEQQVYGKHRPRTIQRVEVDYPLPDGTRQEARLTTSPSVRILHGEQIAVRYVPGVPRMVRLNTETNVFAIVVFGLGVTAMVGFVIWASREANRPYGGRYRAVDDAPVQAKVVGAGKPRLRKSLKPLQPLNDE